MSDFRLQPWPGTIDITTLLEFCSWLDITLEEVEKNGKIRVLSTSARDVVEEYLTVNQHLSREVEGRLVVED